MQHTQPLARGAASGALPLTAAVLVALNALYMLLVAFGNITDFSSNRAFVEHVMVMDTTNFGSPPGVGLDPHVMWRAVTTPWLHVAAYVGVIVWESATAVVLLAATISWCRGRCRSRDRARDLSTLGLLMIIVLFVGGFICVGGEWFAMYRSTAWNGLDPAFRNAVLALLALIVVHLSVLRPTGIDSVQHPVEGEDTGPVRRSDLHRFAVDRGDSDEQKARLRGRSGPVREMSASGTARSS